MLRPAAARTRGAAALVCATRSKRGRGLEPRSLLHGLFTAEHACHHRRAEDRRARRYRAWRHLSDSAHRESAAPFLGAKHCASDARAHGASLPVKAGFCLLRTWLYIVWDSTVTCRMVRADVYYSCVSIRVCTKKWRVDKTRVYTLVRVRSGIQGEREAATAQIKNLRLYPALW